ncbi:hypothetical protein NXC12_PE00284 (plasmid) [Rhizobium etli]|uniref:Uncharacterized protein n=2 Tax=Rhizobium etli TaxID=29449 RepID=A0AAN1BMA5_RHIET|nr:hypothetical protein NXC12_PE00284 [Rhizobium etli]
MRGLTTRTLARHGVPCLRMPFGSPAPALAIGFDFVPISSGILHNLLDEHVREAISPRPDRIIQELAGQGRQE